MDTALLVILSLVSLLCEDKKETIFETNSGKISSLKAEPEPSAFFYWNCGRPSAFWQEPEPPCFG